MFKGLGGVEVSCEEILRQAGAFVGAVEKLESDNLASIKAKQKLEKNIREIAEASKKNYADLDIVTHAIEILQGVSDKSVKESYKFLEESLNSTLAKMFRNTVRKIKLREYLIADQYPQLEIELTVTGGIKRSLKADSGHGVAQIVSVLVILNLIVITNSRRIMIMDEIISGLSAKNREIIAEIMWAFTEIGFQFIVNEHGFIPRGAKVYKLETTADVSYVVEEYVATKGVYIADIVRKTGEEINSVEQETSIDLEVEEEIDCVIAI